MANLKEHIGARGAIGIAKETTKGTLATPTYWVPKLTGNLKPVIEKVNDESGIGRIETVLDSRTVTQSSETAISFNVRDDFIGLFLYTLFGDLTSSVNADASGVVYDHEYTVAQNNTHPSISVREANPVVEGVSSFASPYNMIDSFTINAVAKEIVNAELNIKGKKISSESEQTPAFTLGNLFIGADVNVYFADTLVGLDTADAAELSSVTLNFEKNLEMYQAIGDQDLRDLFNKGFAITGSMEAIYNDDTYKDFVANSTKKYMRIEIKDTTTTIGTAENPTLIFDFNKTSFNEWENTSDNFEIVTQSFNFTGEINTSDAEAVTCKLTNLVSSY